MQLRIRSIAILSFFVSNLLLIGTRTAGAATVTATINSISATGIGKPLGTVTFIGSAQGLVITPNLSGLPPVEHGFHIHEKGDCGSWMNQGKPTAGFAAGGHYDPAHTKRHLGPLSTAGHRGDLPALVVDSRGDATEAVLGLTEVDVPPGAVVMEKIAALFPSLTDAVLALGARLFDWATLRL